MTLPENLNVYISALMFVLGAFFIAVYLGLIVWTFKDIRSRSRDVLVQVLSALLVAVFTLPGLLIYTLLRPQSTLSEEYERRLAEEALLQELDQEEVCPECQRRVEKDFVVCPYCHHQLRLRCIGCGRLLNPAWDVCPYCGLFRDQPEEPSTEPDDEQAQPIAEVQGAEPTHESLEQEQNLMARLPEADIEDEISALDGTQLGEKDAFEETLGGAQPWENLKDANATPTPAEAEDTTAIADESVESSSFVEGL